MDEETIGSFFHDVQIPAATTDEHGLWQAVKNDLIKTNAVSLHTLFFLI